VTIAPVLPHVAQISFFTDPEARPPAQLLQDWPSLVDVAEAASRANIRVSVIQACATSETLTHNNVSYHFLPFGRAAPSSARTQAFGELLARLAPDVCHVHGLGFPHDVQALAKLARATPIVLQDHADRPPPLWRKLSWKRAFAAISGLAFCALEQAAPFASAGLIRKHTKLYEIPESTSRFVPADREAARSATGVMGDPLVLYVGHLNENKDPLTVLAGISAAAQVLPQLRLWCCFGSAPLLRRVRERIAADPNLHDRVHLLGRVPHQTVEQLMRAADLFVLGSHREGSGYSLIEALACGLPPVVTDIPSFRALTASGAVGALWPCGDADKLAEAIVSLAGPHGSRTRSRVRQHFDQELSIDAIGRKLGSMYVDMLRRKAAAQPMAAP
jgi:glycosyltransferase involved in cell wall biosynthesis